jgi:SAM-dependent methyltransferase
VRRDPDLDAERTTRRRTGREPATRKRSEPPSRDARARFLATDGYRAAREWARYEGTPQRDLFRQLRVRFLQRHAVDGGWALDVGAGPGRFTPFVGGPTSRRIALDLARAMLEEIPRHLPAGGPVPAASLRRVQGDSLFPPFPPGGFGEVAVLGNTLGFAGDRSERILDRCEGLVAPGGTLVVEIAPGPGERSRYLKRLPPGAVGRLFEAPPLAVIPRIEREGFTRDPVRHDAGAFRRWTTDELVRRWAPRGWTAVEVLSVAPGLGSDNARASEVSLRPRAWRHLLEVEETIGRREERWPAAAAVLLAARRDPSKAIP